MGKEQRLYKKDKELASDNSMQGSSPFLEEFLRQSGSVFPFMPFTSPLLKHMQAYWHYYAYISQEFYETWMRFQQSIFSNPENVLAFQLFTLRLMEIQLRLFKDYMYGGKQPEKVRDRRFAGEQWQEMPYVMWRDYQLAVERLFEELVEELNAPAGLKEKFRFYLGHIVYALSPSNYLLTNPVAVRKAIESGGASLMKGWQKFIADLQKGKISQYPEGEYEVGVNLAITEGEVIYENPLIQLIRYTPKTDKVYRTPLLIIPPFINKYYVLDLRPENSFVKFLVERGFQVFMVSWYNPDSPEPQFGVDEYVELGIFKPVEVVRQATGADKLHVLGYCIGGTLLAAAAAIYARRGPNPIRTLSFLASLIDFSHFGALEPLITKGLVELMEKDLPGKLWSGLIMNTVFTYIRPNDLLWPYYITNYLLGEEPPALDFMYWTNDNTNIYGKMYAYYMRHMVLENGLTKKDYLTICGIPVDLSRVRVPVCVIAFETDHITPPQTCMRSACLFSGPVTFVLGESGHVMGAINPPSRNKYGYYVDGELNTEGDIEQFKQTARYEKRSWWLFWAEWLAAHDKKQIPVSEAFDSSKFPPIEKAPGRYVKKRIEY